MARAMTVFAVVALLLVATSRAEAEDKPVAELIALKFARGIVNMTTGWLEMPKQIRQCVQEEGWAIGLVKGPFDGLGMFAARTVAGMYETATFFLPLPFGYVPLLEPPFVWQPDPGISQNTLLIPPGPPAER
jgi:putative exosortase-associated protein (TIGR04073 family)